MFFVSTQKWEKSFKIVQKNTTNCQRYQFYFILFLYFKAFDLLQCHVTFIYLFFFCIVIVVVVIVAHIHRLSTLSDCFYCHKMFFLALRARRVLCGASQKSRLDRLCLTSNPIHNPTLYHTTTRKGEGVQQGGNREQCAPQFVIARTQIVSIFYYALLQQYIHMGQYVYMYICRLQLFVGKKK